MKKLTLMFFLALLSNAYAYAAEVNSGDVFVAEVRADTKSDMSNDTYYYTFNGRLGNECGISTGEGNN